MFNKLKNLFSGKKTEVPAKTAPKSKQPRKPKEAKKEVKLTEKEEATNKGEPFISILKVEVDPSNINSGSFELDWNDKFVLNLIRAGYKQRPDDTDQVIVDRWFQTVCRNIALEVYEQQVADPDNRDIDDIRRVSTRDLGNGRTEVS